MTNMVAQALDHPGDNIALHEYATDRSWTYGELSRACRGVSDALTAAGVGPDDRVALFGGNHLEFFAGWLGIAGHGAILSSINLLLGPAEKAAILENLEPKVILAERAVADAAGAARPQCPLIVLEDVALATGDPFEVVPRDDDDLVSIAYTSGTTGPLPKGAVHRHAVPSVVANGTAEALGLEMGDTVLSFLPNFQIPAFANIPLVAFYLGSTCLLMDRLDVDAVLDAVQNRDVKIFTSVPTALYDLLEGAEAKGVRFDSLRCGPVGGAPLPPVLQERAMALGWIPVNIYGSTETCGNVAVQRPDRELRVGATGPADAGARLSVRDPVTFEELPAGEEGEVCVGEERACLRYWRNEDATADAFRDGWFRTGDMGRFDGDGELYIVDRLKDLIIRGGFNIAPAEVERVLIRHRIVGEVIVVGEPDERLGEVPIAYVVAAEGAEIDKTELLAFAHEHLGAVKCPVRIDEVDQDALPRGPLGKVRKPDLKKMVAAGEIALR
ncbi:MAG: class I adenylate-forming enzyme family protein [Microthrixaceae bacterium]